MPEVPGTLRAILDSATDAIVIADAAGVVVAWNPAAERIFGFSASDVVGQSLTLMIPERFHDAHRAGIGRAVSGGDGHLIGSTVETAGRRNDGTEIPIAHHAGIARVVGGGGNARHRTRTGTSSPSNCR